MPHDGFTSADDKARNLQLIANHGSVCPRCARSLAGLLQPVCPGCGSKLSLGVAAPPRLTQHWVWLLMSQAIKLPIGLVFIVGCMTSAMPLQWGDLLRVRFLLSTVATILTVPLIVKLRRPIMRMSAIARWTLLVLLTAESAVTIGYITVYLR